MTSANQPWHTANLVALDLEGSGAQERGDEQILEIAAIRLVDGEPDMATAYTTCVDPGRAIPAKPWISPGLSGLVWYCEVSRPLPRFAAIFSPD